MEVQWKEHTLRVTGDWTARWLFMAPDYELWLDEQRLDRSGGPRLNHRLEAIFEDEQGEHHHIEANLVSIAGFKPRCNIQVAGQSLAQGHVPVQNILNPFLIIVILLSTVVMLYVGPDVVRGWMNR